MQGVATPLSAHLKRGNSSGPSGVLGRLMVRNNAGRKLPREATCWSRGERMEA